MAHGLTVAGSVGAILATVHTAHNLRVLRVPPHHPRPVHERVSVLVPARDEAERIEACLRALCASTSLPDLEIVVLDDGSSDTTAALVQALSDVDPRIRLIDGSSQAPPSGWLGKPWACVRLAAAATGSVLVFVDADVIEHLCLHRAVPARASVRRFIDGQQLPVRRCQRLAWRRLRHP